MLVRQLVGRYAGEIVEMPHLEAQACLATGTAALPDDHEAAKRVKGLKMPSETAPEPAAEADQASEGAPEAKVEPEPEPEPEPAAEADQASEAEPEAEAEPEPAAEPEPEPKPKPKSSRRKK